MAETRRVWEPRYGHALSDEEAIEMLVNVGRLFDVLTDTGIDNSVDAEMLPADFTDSA